MKQCSFCSEYIQNKAIKCRYCWEWLNKNNVATDYSSKILKTLIVLLILAIIWFWPYEFYLLNRLIVFVLSLYLLIKEKKRESYDEFRFWVYVSTAIAYNPFALVYLNRWIWTLIDLALIYLFYKFLKQYEKM
jgi:hypothetical protein